MSAVSDRVRSSGGGRLVRFASEDPDAPALSCTCAWWAAYQGGRGPCRHVLAARLHRRHTDEPEQD